MKKPFTNEKYGQEILDLIEGLEGLCKTTDEKMTLNLLVEKIYKTGLKDGILFMTRLE